MATVTDADREAAVGLFPHFHGDDADTSRQWVAEQRSAIAQALAADREAGERAGWERCRKEVRPWLAEAVFRALPATPPPASAGTPKEAHHADHDSPLCRKCGSVMIWTAGWQAYVCANCTAPVPLVDALGRIVPSDPTAATPTDPALAEAEKRLHRWALANSDNPFAYGCDAILVLSALASERAQREAAEARVVERQAAVDDHHDLATRARLWGERRQAERDAEKARADAAEKARDEARAWVDRMQRESRTITCVYCGYPYPPGTPTSGAEALTAHVRTCEKHPLRAAESRANAAAAEAGRLRDALAGAEKAMAECGVGVSNSLHPHGDYCVYCDWPLARPWPGGPSIVGTIVGHRDICPLLAVRSAIAPPTATGGA